MHAVVAVQAVAASPHTIMALMNAVMAAVHAVMAIVHATMAAVHAVSADGLSYMIVISLKGRNARIFHTVGGGGWRTTSVDGCER